MALFALTNIRSVGISIQDFSVSRFFWPNGNLIVGVLLFRVSQRQPLELLEPFRMDNITHYASQLPLPRRDTSPQRALTEMPNAVTNARDGSRKHHLSSLPEPASKRVTLAERAGEPLRPNLLLTPSSSIAHGAMQPPRNFSQSYRSNSSHTRTISGSTNSSFSSSIGPSGIRRPSAQTIARPKISLAKGRNTSGAVPRPATAMDTRVGRINEDPTKRKLPCSLAPRMEPLRKPPYNDRYSARNMPPPKFRLPFAKMDAVPACITGQQGQRNSSLSTVMDYLRLDSNPVQVVNMVEIPRTLSGSAQASTLKEDGIVTPSRSPSKLPRPMTPAVPFISPALSEILKSRQRHPVKFKQFLTRNSNIEAWDVDEQYSNIEAMHDDMKRIHATLNQAANENDNMKDSLALHKSTIQTLEKDRSSLTEANITLRTDLETMRCTLVYTERSIAELKERHNAEIERAQEAVKDIKKSYEEQIDQEKRLRTETLNQLSTASELRRQQEEIRLAAKAQENDSLKAEILRLTADLELESVLKIELQKNLASTTATGSQEMNSLKTEILRLNAELEQESLLKTELQKTLAATTATRTTLEISRNALQAKIEYLESDSKSQSESYATMERERNEAILRAELADAAVRKAESQSRRDRDTIQQLRGNIQVISRQRPNLDHDNSSDLAIMSYPDTEQLTMVEVRGPEEKSSLGTVVTKSHPFAFDRAFGPSSSNTSIWEEVQPLVQSAIDGFNVCMFAYGQTGSGKTYTMSAPDGVMPRAIHHIYDTTKNLDKLGWKYTVQGKFLEVYNENIHDLLGDVDQMDKKKHEIKHDMQKCETIITDVTVVDLDSKETVESVVERAMARRSVAATKLNERSSRSHSVFILTLSGHNSITGERSKGTLNLVDLAGSERVSRSKVEGERLKETQNINKSLSSLGDVIGALGKKEPGAHIPYRNSKLTHLLQLSLGGNSKTLMFVMVSPLKEHLAETLTSLKFATKVHGTHIGTARKVGK